LYGNETRITSKVVFNVQSVIELDAVFYAS